MSLLDGAHKLAESENVMGCTVEHVFLTAIIPEGHIYRDAETNRALEIFTGLTLREWALQARTRLEQFKDPPPLGKDSQQLTDVIGAARTDAQARRHELDDLTILYFIVTRTPHIQGWIDRINPGDAKRLMDRLSEVRGGGADPLAASGVKETPQQQAAQEEAKQARENLPDLLDEVDPSPDLRYAEFAAIDVKTFLDNLAEAEDVDHVVVAIGRDGTLINELPKVVADRLQKGNTFSGQQASLNAYIGKLYRMDLRKVIDRARQKKTFKPVTVLNEASKQLLALPQKPILLLDHIEALRPDLQNQAQENELKDMRAQITDPGQLLVFGIFHAPNHGDHAGEATLGRPDIVITQPMNLYNEKQTKALIQQFYLKHWQKEGRSYEFASNTFDALIALEQGAWVRRRRMVLPCLVTEVVSDAMSTALLGNAQIEATASCALNAFEELRKEEAQGHPEREHFESILNKAEKEVRGLLPSNDGNWLSNLFGGAQQGKVEPGKRIKITSAHVIAEFICHNISEFHYPGKFPSGITEEV